jgi:hypothetical protein
MTMTTEHTYYTVFNNHGSVQERGCTVAEAAQTVMDYDGHSFEIRPASDGKGFELWTSQFSQNSPAGGRPLVKSVIFSLIEDRASAEAEIYGEVIKRADMWKGCDVMLDADYDAMATNKAE